VEAGKEKIMSDVSVFYMDARSVSSINLLVRFLAYYRSSVQSRKWLDRFNDSVAL
jgi:hypothetical protein